MAFDFSKYTAPNSAPPPVASASPPAAAAAPPTSVGQYTPGFSQGGSAAGLDPTLASQVFNYIGKDDSDANLLGADTKQKLIDAGLIQPITEGNNDSGGGQTFYELGKNAPTNFQGHITTTDHTPETQRIIGADVTSKMGGLTDPNNVYKDPLWGNVTTEGNKNQHDSMDTFWKIAPMIPAAFAAVMSGGAMAPLLAEMPEAGGATAGSLVGDQTISSIGGGALNGITSGANNIFSNLPAAFQKAVPNTIKGTIQGLSSGNGKFDFTKYIPQALSMASSAAGLPGYAMPLASAAFNLAKGGGFDFTNYLGNMAANTGINMIKQGLK